MLLSCRNPTEPKSFAVESVVLSCAASLCKHTRTHHMINKPMKKKERMCECGVYCMCKCVLPIVACHGRKFEFVSFANVPKSMDTRSASCVCVCVFAVLVCPCVMCGVGYGTCVMCVCGGVCGGVCGVYIFLCEEVSVVCTFAGLHEQTARSFPALLRLASRMHGCL